jgi:adenosylcobyric acid synthase
VSALAVQGASSSAGKSLLVTALCRLFARRGVRVAPFKAQNMSNNARVVAGGEIGVAQYLQAQAAGLEPDVRMNPVLVKPEGERSSQIVVSGIADLALSRMPWRERAPLLRPVVEESLRSLLSEFELVLIEGAGSPAEVNLRDCDLANMHVALAAKAPVVLVADIDRGGAFAHLYGTWALLAPAERALVSGFVLNKFRGDASLLAPAPAELERLTGVRLLGLVPWLEHGLADEDGVGERLPRDPPQGRPLAAVVRYPYASNLDEFRLLEQVADVVYARRPAQLAGADLVVLPGSKSVASDLAWLREHGFAAVLRSRAQAKEPLLAICGGLQMLGERLLDRGGVEGSAAGLGLLPLATEFEAEKQVLRTRAAFLSLGGPWQALSGLSVSGYEIRHGHSTATGPVAPALPDGLGFVSEAVLGVYLHGLLEDPVLVSRLLGVAPPTSLEAVLEELADAVEPHLELERLETIALGAQPGGGRRMSSGSVEAIHISAGTGEPLQALDSVKATSGVGLEGDRYALGRGHYSHDLRVSRDLTLVEAEVVEALEHEHAIALAPGETRRNVTTRGVRLNELVGRRFTVGEVLCEGTRLCEPCQHLADLVGKPILYPLVHRGGLRAEILTDGEIRVGDPIRLVEA